MSIRFLTGGERCGFAFSRTSSRRTGGGFSEWMWRRGCRVRIGRCDAEFARALGFCVCYSGSARGAFFRVKDCSWVGVAKNARRVDRFAVGFIWRSGSGGDKVRGEDLR